MHDATGRDFQRRLDRRLQRLERLEARADRLNARLTALGELDPQVPPGMYALVMEINDFEFEERRLLRLIVEHLEELRNAWFDLREDSRRGRLRERHVLVD